MGEVRKLDIALSEDMAGAFDAAIATGDYADEADIVGVALAQWRQRQADHIVYLRRMWAEGIASGEPIEATDDFFDNIKRRGHALLEARRAAG